MTLATAQACEPAAAARAAASRVFVGLKIAPEIAAQLAEFTIGFEKPVVRPVAAADIHLTLVPPWNEPCVQEAIDKLSRVAARFAPFILIIRHVGYGPQSRRPRLLWADCAASDEMSALHAVLLAAFGQSDARAFQPHVTLARIRANGAAVARKHPIDQPLSLRQRVESIELFQSPPAGGTGYQVLASLPLGEAVGPTPKR